MTSDLTRAYAPEVEAKINSTFPGMASFAGDTPGKTCRECINFAHGNKYSAKRGMSGGKLKDASCNKYRRMMQQTGPAFSPTAAACKFFEQNSTPPELYAKESA
jgi:hypothetical protein